VAHRVDRGIAVLFHDLGTRRGWVVSSMPRPHFTLGKDPVPINIKFYLKEMHFMDEWWLKFV
jgi:hypothetical protein